MPAVIPAELWQESGRWEQLRHGAAAPEGPQRPRLLLRADARGGGHRPRAPRGALVPRPAEEPLPDPGEVPGRGAAALRAHARPRVHHEGRVLVPRRPRRRASASTEIMYDTYTRIFERCGLDVPRRRGGHRRHRRLAVARVPGARRRRARTRSCRCDRCELRRQRREGGGAARCRRRRRRAARSSASRRPGKRTVEEVSALPRRCRRSAS